MESSENLVNMTGSAGLDSSAAAPAGAAAGAVPVGYLSLKDGAWEEQSAGEVIEETEFCIYVNGAELATIAATPLQLEALTLGFLANEGLINNLAEVRELSLRGQGYCMDLWLTHSIQMPERLVRTSGCTGGVTFDHLAKQIAPLSDDSRWAVDEVAGAIHALYQQAALYQRVRGVHTSGLWRAGRMLVTAEDVGRHNTLDKLRGQCLLQGLDPAGALLVSTGRISSEMLGKAARMGCPVVASRTSATSLSIKLARTWNITLAGYVRSQPGAGGSRMLVYSHPERLNLPGGAA